MSVGKEPAIITKTNAGYELSDGKGESVALYSTWDLVEQMLRGADYAEHEIERHKQELDRGGRTVIDEANE